MPTEVRVLLFGLVFGAMSVWATSALSETASMATPERGKAIYDKYCAHCHGLNGRADTPLGHVLNPPPRDLTDPVEAARMTDDQLYRSIKLGRPGTAMPAWGQVLGELEIGDVMEYVQGLAPPRPATLSAQRLGVEIGRRIYDANCAECHGKDGRPNTEAGRVLRPRPRNFADPIEMARVDDGRMYSAIKLGRPGTSMGGWGGALSPAEIIDVMRYTRTLVQPRAEGMTVLQFDVRVGERIYRQYCVSCHGAQGDGDTALGRVLVPRPPNFVSAQEMARVDRKEMAQIVANGKPGSVMTAWLGILNPEDVRRVTLYIRYVFQHQI